MPFIAATAVGIPPDLQGQRAFSVLSAQALTAIALDQADSLQISPLERAHPEALNVALRERLESPHERVREVATSVLQTFGLRLGYLIAILKRGDAESRAAREDWDDSYWAYWGRIERFYLGGGLACAEVCDAAVRAARDAGVSTYIEVAPFPAARPLTGAARSLALRDGAALVLDFGQTATKRAVAAYGEGLLCRLNMLPPVPSTTLQGRAYSGSMAELIVASLPQNTSVAGICVSSYLDDKQHPAVYASGRLSGIHDEIENLRTWLSDEVSRIARRAVEISLFHDCSAAGAGLSPGASSAIIMLGTALGSGFPFETDEHLTPSAPDFTATEYAQA